jgi:DNA-binding CsgD family transcriptional regulator
VSPEHLHSHESRASARVARSETAHAFVTALETSPETILDSISDLVEVIDSRGIITYSNKPFSHQAMLGQGCGRTQGAACRDCVDNPLDEVLRSGRSLTLECPVDTGTGKTGWVRQRLYPIADSRGGVSSVLRLVFDITHEKQEQVRQDKYLDSLEQSLYNRENGGPPFAHQELSAREQEVLSFVADGMSNQEIARLLGISHHTVKSHVVHIFNKLGVKDRTQAAVAATRMKLV